MPTGKGRHVHCIIPEHNTIDGVLERVDPREFLPSPRHTYKLYTAPLLHCFPHKYSQAVSLRTVLIKQLSTVVTHYRPTLRYNRRLNVKMQVRLPHSLHRLSGLSAAVHSTSALHDARTLSAAVHSTSALHDARTYHLTRSTKTERKQKAYLILQQKFLARTELRSIRMTVTNALLWSAQFEFRGRIYRITTLSTLSTLSSTILHK
jgi:hypothetical protein